MYWSLTDEGAAVLREQIISEFRTLTNFATQFETRDVAIQTVSNFLRGERLSVDIARQITAALVSDVDEFRSRYIQLLPFKGYRPSTVDSDLTDLLLEGLVSMTSTQQHEFLRLCREIPTPDSE